MAKIVVTGASGLLGSAIIEELSHQNVEVTACVYPGQNMSDIGHEAIIEGLNITVESCNLLNPNDVNEVLSGCSILFHTDHYFSIWKKDARIMEEFNINATKNLMLAALKQGVEKVVYCSGMETLRSSIPGNLTNEDDGISIDDIPSLFGRTRFRAEQWVQHYRKSEALPAIITHPTFLISSLDRGKSLLSKYLRSWVQKPKLHYLDTGLNLILAKDAAKAHLLAAKAGKIGQRYIISNENIYLEDLLEWIDTCLKRKIHRKKQGFWAYYVSRLLEHKNARLPLSVLKELENPLFFDSTKAVKELKIPQNDLWEELEKLITFFYHNRGK